MSVLSVAALFLVAFVGLFGLGLVAGLFWLLWRVVKVVFWLLGRTLNFARKEVVGVVHAVGALVTAAVTVPLAAVNLAILRVGAARHYGRAFADELKGVGVGVWRVAFGNPLRFLGLGGLVEGIERRLPDVMESAPRTRRARRATFEGYDVIGTLPSGGSGAQLFVARPKPATHKRFLDAGRGLPGEVVIKSFALEAGSTLPQIVRESRALEAASRLGLVCEHQLTNDHFYYVMPYVKGEDLERVTRALHARGSAEGLADAELGLVLGYAIDLCDSLQRFHSGGLWHKDVKPANVIVAKGRAHLVDFGLVTPLSSAMTLTTHGTEYYRDPEMVRLAMQGVKVHEVDGVRFDVYSAGAVLYSLIENSFPAHGSLSRISRRCPDALRWIVQRAMAEMGSRYPSAGALRADLAHLAVARDPFAVRPADLPSFGNAGEPAAAPPPLFVPRRAPEPEPAAFQPVADPSGWRPRRRRFPVLAPAVAGMAALLFATCGAFFVGRVRAEHREPWDPTVTARASTRSWPRLTERERRVMDLAEGVVEEIGVDEPAEVAAPVATADGARVAHAEVSAPVRTDPGVDAGAALLPARGRVLLLDELATDTDDRVLAHLGAQLDQRGFDVVGRESDGSDAAEAIELIAGARNALGLGRADEEETQASLQRFLDATEALDALIVISRADEDEHLYRVFVRTSATR